MHKITADRYLSAMKMPNCLSLCKDGSKSMDQAQRKIGRLSRDKRNTKDEPETSGV